MYTLIIVDDELKIREGIANLFPWEQNGFSIAGLFPNGQAALSYIREHPVDVVLTDIRMPVMDGLALSAVLAREFPRILHIFLTGYQDFSYMRAAIQNRAADYLLKPIKYEELYACFEQVRRRLDEMHPCQTENPSVQKGYYGKIVSQVSAYLDISYRTATLEEAAAQVNLSPNYLSRIFKEKSGTGFAEYLNTVRMKKAAELLCDVTYRHYEIADRIGYDNPKNFSRAFKQYYGISPREFREKNVS